MKKNQLYFAAMALGIVMTYSCGDGSSSKSNNKDTSTSTENIEVKSGVNAPIPDMPGWEQVTDGGFMFGEWKDDNGITTNIDIDHTNPDAGISWSEQMEGAEKTENEEFAKVQICSNCTGSRGEGYITVKWKSIEKPMCYQYKMFKKGNEAQMLLSLQGEDVVRIFKRTI